MGLLMRNGIEYGGSGGGDSANIVELTQEEYDALPDSKLTDGVLYAIKDVDSLSTLKSMNINGVFIDTDRVIYSNFTFDEEPHDWVATEDCILTDNLIPPDQNNKACFIRINGKQVHASYSPVDDPFVYVKKGQTVTYRAKSGSIMKAYGVQPASNVTVLHDYLSSCYSTTERQIGCWVDGKPLYKRSYNFDSDLSINSNSWEISPIPKENIEKIVNVEATNNAGNCWNGLISTAVTSSNYIQLYNSRTNSSIVVRQVTLYYTKTTDTPGSGTWTPVGTPTVHHSTEETCIGTWINGSPLYEKVYNIQARSSEISTSLLADLNIDVIVDCHIMIWDGSTYKRQELQYNSNTKLLSDIPGTKWISHISVQYTKA